MANPKFGVDLQCVQKVAETCQGCQRSLKKVSRTMRSSTASRAADVRRRHLRGLVPAAHLELHAALEEPLDEARRACHTRRQHATPVGQLLPIEAQRERGLNGQARRLVVPVAADEAALQLAAVVGLGMQKETAPSVRHVRDGRAVSLLVLRAVAFENSFLVLEGHAVLPNGLSRLVTLLGPAPSCRDVLRWKHCVLHEIQRHAVRPVAQVCLQHVRAPHDARVEEGVHVGRPPDAQLAVFRDLRHVDISVLFSRFRRHKAGARLHVDNLEAVPVDLRDEATQSERIAPRMLGRPVTAERRPCPQCAPGGAASRAAPRAVADRIASALAVILLDLLRQHHDTEVGVSIARAAGHNHDSSLNCIPVQLLCAHGPGQLHADVDVIGFAPDACIDQHLALCEHVGASAVHDNVRALDHIDDRDDVVEARREDGCVRPLRAHKLAVAHLGDLRDGAAGEGEGEVLLAFSQRIPFQVLHHQIPSVSRHAVENDVVLFAIPLAAPAEVHELCPVLFKRNKCTSILTLGLLHLHDGISQRFILGHHVRAEVLALEGWNILTRVIVRRRHLHWPTTA
mmetsp:Transcript_12665/g.44808  ORF Transcript_12665/g.44808 Transcript_12665/m.44808 type:complete len:569 (-) Transcript_12665:29-1735(-)